MVHAFLFISTILVLVLFFYQWRIMNRQHQYIKAETESLRKIREENGKFIPTGMFGLLPESSYLNIARPESEFQQNRGQFLSQHYKNKKKKYHQPF